MPGSGSSPAVGPPSNNKALVVVAVMVTALVLVGAVFYVGAMRIVGSRSTGSVDRPIPKGDTGKLPNGWDMTVVSSEFRDYNGTTMDTSPSAEFGATVPATLHVVIIKAQFKNETSEVGYAGNNVTFTAYAGAARQNLEGCNLVPYENPLFEQPAAQSGGTISASLCFVTTTKEPSDVVLVGTYSGPMSINAKPDKSYFAAT